MYVFIYLMLPRILLITDCTQKYTTFLRVKRKSSPRRLEQTNSLEKNKQINNMVLSTIIAQIDLINFFMHSFAFLYSLVVVLILSVFNLFKEKWLNF